MLVSAILLLGCFVSSVEAEMPMDFFENYCLHCHDSKTRKAEINLEELPENWSAHDTVALWGRILRVIETEEMPPDAKPVLHERRAAVRSVQTLLAAKSPVGGTILQRLNKIQYERSLRNAFPDVRFELPQSFPADVPEHGFDNIGEALSVSPPLMEQYLAVATQLADEIIQPPVHAEAVKSSTTVLKATDFTENFDGSKVIGVPGDQRLRLVSRNEVVIRSASWASGFEAVRSGTYELTIRASAFKPVDEEPMHLEVRSAPPTISFSSINARPKLAVLKVKPGEPQEFKLTVRLDRGNTILFYWSDAPLGWTKANRNAESTKQFREFLSDKATYAAWKKIGRIRGRSGGEAWRQMCDLVASGKLDLEDPSLDRLPRRFLPFLNELNDIICNKMHQQGPAVDVREMIVRGPLQVFEEKEVLVQRRGLAQFLGARNGQSDTQWAGTILRPLLTRLFRRPISDKRLDDYVRLAVSHAADRKRFADGIHLAIRAAMTSPEFLYIVSKPGRLDDFDLASRLSYFLTSGPPDSKLLAIAESGELSKNASTLAAETRRLLKSRVSQPFIENFTGQWLGTRRLADIMPDPRLLKYSDETRKAMIAETELFFSAVLRNNLPVEDFIAPDFTFMNQELASRIYEMPFPGSKKKDAKMRRITLPREGRFGGILGQASVMMATANGVDTQPVLRGVWVMENVLGTAPPPPPKNVPAISPDITGAQTIRERLAAHRKDQSCAMCHRKIDPLGFALENFDPVGRWRDQYPRYAAGEHQANRGDPIVAASKLPDGTILRDVTDLKRYVVRNIDGFSQCLGEKLLTYGTGRPMSYGDKQVVKRVIQEVKAKGSGFQDLIVALVLSESFATK